jgi:hypothetical protein
MRITKMLDAVVFKEVIFHFPFIILDLSFEEIGLSGFHPNDKSKIINGK